GLIREIVAIWCLLVVVCELTQLCHKNSFDISALRVHILVDIDNRIAIPRYNFVTFWHLCCVCRRFFDHPIEGSNAPE
ncbi:MAG: hypothetical protein ORN49_14640, partial [Rhodobacteraceae bacterium]|nr:hypothetical protein [Paracoccaceae bacterium]